MSTSVFRFMQDPLAPVYWVLQDLQVNIASKVQDGNHITYQKYTEGVHWKMNRKKKKKLKPSITAMAVQRTAR